MITQKVETYVWFDVDDGNDEFARFFMAILEPPFGSITKVTKSLTATKT